MPVSKPTAPSKPPVPLSEKIWRTARFAAMTSAVLAALYFGVPALIGGSLAMAGAVLMAHIPGLVTSAIVGGLFGGAWRTVEEAANSKLDAIKGEAQAAELKEKRRDGKSQDYSKLYDATGVEPSGNKAAQVLEQRRQELAVASAGRTV